MAKQIGDGKSILIDNLTFGRYIQGSQALGYILQVRDHELQVSLPGGLTGVVSYEEISDYFHKLRSERLNNRDEKVRFYSYFISFAIHDDVGGATNIEYFSAADDSSEMFRVRSI